MSSSQSSLLILPGQGEKLNSMTVKVRSAALGGDFSIMESQIAPHQLLAPHTHENEDQAVFVISGELEFEVGGEGGERFTAAEGSYVIKPRGVQHGFWNATDRPCRYIELSGRDGFEQFVDESDEAPVKASIQAKKRYALTFHYARIPVLLARHNLTSVVGLDMPWEGAKVPWQREDDDAASRA